MWKTGWGDEEARRQESCTCSLARSRPARSGCGRAGPGWPAAGRPTAWSSPRTAAHAGAHSRRPGMKKKADGGALVSGAPALLEDAPAADPAGWDLRLYVAGQTAKSVAAFDNLKR